MNQALRPLLILDIDETLLHATVDRLTHRSHDFEVGPYLVHNRPHLRDFLQGCYAAFRVAYWSSGTADYVGEVVERINPYGCTPEFIWARNRCTMRYHSELLEYYFVKDLKKVKRRGFDLQQVLIVDDTPAKAERNFGNAIYVTPYTGLADDDELPQLLIYLVQLSKMQDYRSIDKRGWRHFLQR